MDRRSSRMSATGSVEFAQLQRSTTTQTEDDFVSPDRPSREIVPEKRSSNKAQSFLSRSRICGPVVQAYGDLPLLACCFVTGMVDGASFRNWGMFVGMQTGNTVILGLSTAGLPANPHVWLTTLVSILAFLFGAYTTFRASKLITPTGPTANRLWMSSLFLIQAAIIILSAALATAPGLIPQNPGGTTRTEADPTDVLHNIRIASLITPLAFQSGMQIATSRLLGYNAIPINVITSSYCDLMGDYKLFALNNVKRDQRAVAAALLLIGSIVSGRMMRSHGGLMSVLWASGGIKLIASIAVFCFVPALSEDAVLSSP